MAYTRGQVPWTTVRVQKNIAEKFSKSSVTRRASFVLVGQPNTGKPEMMRHTRPAKREDTATQPSWRSTTQRSAHAIPQLMVMAATEPALSQLCRLSPPFSLPSQPTVSSKHELLLNHNSFYPAIRPLKRAKAGKLKRTTNARESFIIWRPDHPSPPSTHTKILSKRFIQNATHVIQHEDLTQCNYQRRNDPRSDCLVNSGSIKQEHHVQLFLFNT